MNKQIIIAIDGHSSCGKSTMAKSLARKLSYIYVDTGAMYRGVTLAAMRAGIVGNGFVKETEFKDLLKNIDINFELNPTTQTPELLLNKENVEKEIRGMEVSALVSPVAAIPEVRAFLTQQQQAMGNQGGIVMDGRDIGTNVFPNAELKIFLTAESSIRAERRLKELRAKGDETTTLEEVLQNINERDYIDSHREVSPLRQADDAIVLDNSHLTIEQQDQRLLELYQNALNKIE